MLSSILIVIIVLVILIISVDLILEFDTWQSRIKIGRFKTKDTWGIAVKEKSKQWLKKSPTIKLTDNNRLVIIDMLSGNYRRDAIQYWQEAALILGLSANYKLNPDTEVKKAIDNYINDKIDSNGNWKKPILESDGVILGYALIQLDWLDHNKYYPAYDALWNMLIDLKGEDGTISYKKHTRQYRFVDTIGFISPFLIHYGQKFNKPEAIDLGIKQIEEFNKFGMLKDEFIPCHTYVVDSKLPAGLFGWGRGLGWYAIGLIDSWNDLDDSHPKKNELKEWVLRFAQVCMRFQRENGSWGWLITQDSSRSDSSATATLAWFLKNAAKIDQIKDASAKASEKALNYLMTVTRRSGAVDFSQGDTKGIGIYSAHFDVLPFTQGFCLRTLNDVQNRNNL